ncbi:transmembrane protein 272 isoform X1 [Gasterosteus aculeatus]|uniref:transmembrane protein 272-like isoform X1 n=1 Tax=Gasterosteus aculeatus aculeatus TaxID=481459 RepID=UPI001A9966CA|nr:transmembrane protein 272-like isoform X1 [Gasterosteus aculeatus aculeatus]
MNPSPQDEVRPQSAVLIASLVVLNMIWWMIMITAIGLGATHLSLCPVQSNIPIYLIALGVSNLLALSLTYTSTTWGEGMVSIMCSTCTAILHLISFGLFFAGSTWVYPVYPPDYTPGALRYCHRTTYQFAFAVTTLVWAAATLIFICGCCFALVTCATCAISGNRLLPGRYSFYGSTRHSHEPAGGDV